MPDEEDTGNVFAMPDFHTPSQWLGAATPPGALRFFAMDISGTPSSSIFKPPTIENTLYFALPESDARDEPTPPTPPQPVDLVLGESGNEDASDDIWLSIRDQATKSREYKTWDHPESSVGKPFFVTEAGPGVFDALAGQQGDPLRLQSTECSVVESRAYLDALLSLALGRGSVFFSWNEASKSFKSTASLVRLSGYSQPVLRGVTTSCLQSGNALRSLRGFVDETYRTNPTPCRVALASALHDILLAIQKSASMSRKPPRSVLQLQALARRLCGLLLLLESLVLKTRKCRSDEGILDLVFQVAQVSDNGHHHNKNLLREILQRVSEPWLGFVAGWIGTNPELGVPLSKDDAGARKGFVIVEAEVFIDELGDSVEQLDFRLDTARVPAFMPEAIIQSLFETGRNLRFIKSNHPEHPLSQRIAGSMKTPALKWQFNWSSIRRIEEDVRSYGSDAGRMVKTHARNPSVPTINPPTASMPSMPSGRYELRLFSTDKDELHRHFLQSMEELSRPKEQKTTKDKMGLLIQKCISDGDTGSADTGIDATPHWSLLPVLSFGSIVACQARIVGQESLKLLFTAHKLREHLDLQRDFQLCRNGMFCSRLSQALFDTNMETTERQAGVALQGGMMGLRLGGRDTWPPASSELRLALMGVLAESFNGLDQSNQAGRMGGHPGTRGLPGDLSFGVRNLSGDEIDKCMDPNGLEALDFLRLTYKVPAALSSIITPEILSQYDQVFRLLLRILRMQHSVNVLLREITATRPRHQEPDDASVRFCFEARHFVFGISCYFFDVGIKLPWQRFEEKLGAVETELFQERKSPSSDAHLRPSVNPDRIREHHAETLKTIMSGLLLRKRQQPVLKLLEDIFRVILQFSIFSSLGAGRGQEQNQEHDLEREQNTMSPDDNATAQKLYRSFRKKVEVFLTVCRAMAEKEGTKSRGAKGRETQATDLGQDGQRHCVGSGEEGTPLAQLLMRLDMFNYYLKA